MAKEDNFFSMRKTLDEICTVPDKIISVYSLEKHVWSDSNSEEARRDRKPELKTIEEFQIEPVRPFLFDIFRNIAAPYKPERKENPIGQGYWIQAEFGSGKSHLLCLLSSLALGNKQAWQIVDEKEKKANKGKRESLNQFWEEGLAAKSSGDSKGIFVIVKTLVGVGGGTVGIEDKGQRLTDYILDATKEQLQIELGKNISLYPAELLADRFINKDLDRFHNDLKKFLRDPNYFEEDEFEDIDAFIRDIQQNKSPEYKRSCGNKLWVFYNDYLGMRPDVSAETEEVLKHLVETILAEGYSGVLLVLDEVSLFMKNRDEQQRTDDENTLVVLSNRLAKVHNLPIWTVCSAQQAIESKMGVKNIIADDRLKLVKLLEEDNDYYDIVLARVREIKDPEAIANYYAYYKRGFTWPNSIGEQEFTRFFPFHKPTIEVLRAVTYELTTARSAIHFMHQTLKHQIKNKGNELIRLWELFDEAVRYEEDPSGVHAGLVAIKTSKETEYKAYEACKRQIDSLTKGYLKHYRDKAIKTIQTLFLYHISKTRQQGLTPEDIANSVLIERDVDSNPEENIQHYEDLAEQLKKELPQIAQNYDEDKRPRYRFDPVFTGIDPRDEYRKARDEAESNEAMLKEAWQHLIALDKWQVKTRTMTIDFSNGVQSVFRQIALYNAPWQASFLSSKDLTIEINWQGRQVSGSVAMRDLAQLASSKTLPLIESDDSELDFAMLIGIRPVPEQNIADLLAMRKDPRLMIWTPDELTTEENERLKDFAAYRKLVFDWQGKETEDARAIIDWVDYSLRDSLGKIYKAVDNSFARGRIDAYNNTRMDFEVRGELETIIAPLTDRVLTAVYESRDIKFEPPFIFRKEEGMKVINGIVKTGSIPKNAKPNKDISAAQNFGLGLKIIKRGTDRELDTTDNPYVQAIWSFIDDKLGDDGQPMRITTLYKNFMGIGGPKDYGLTKRMVQIYLLCLVKQGKVRVGLGPKSGLPHLLVDYSNIADIDFSAKVLDSLTEVQKLEKPENWETLRPYAEKLLRKDIPSTHDDAVISKYRIELVQMFSTEKEAAPRIVSKTKALFDSLETINPYDVELQQVATLFSADVASGDDISLILYALKQSLGYVAFDTDTASSVEVDDLANRLKKYRDLQRLLGFDEELKTAYKYSHHELPDMSELSTVKEAQRMLYGKLNNLRPYIDSDVACKTELIGHMPAEQGEKGTLGSLINEYSTLYAAMHDATIEILDKSREKFQALLDADELKALELLEKVSALKPPISAELKVKLHELNDKIFICNEPSRASIEHSIAVEPMHECGLSFGNRLEFINEAESLSAAAANLFNESFNKKIEVFLNPTIIDRLEQGKENSVIEKLLTYSDVPALRNYLTKESLSDPSVIDMINRYLKQIKVKQVKIADFKPSMGVIEKAQIPELVQEFQDYLQEQISSIEDDDALPMLQLE